MVLQACYRALRDPNHHSLQCYIIHQRWRFLYFSLCSQSTTLCVISVYQHWPGQIWWYTIDVRQEGDKWRLYPLWPKHSVNLPREPSILPACLGKSGHIKPSFNADNDLLVCMLLKFAWPWNEIQKSKCICFSCESGRGEIRANFHGWQFLPMRWKHLVSFFLRIFFWNISAVSKLSSWKFLLMRLIWLPPGTQILYGTTCRLTLGWKGFNMGIIRKVWSRNQMRVRGEICEKHFRAWLCSGLNFFSKVNWRHISKLFPGSPGESHLLSKLTFCLEKKPPHLFFRIEWSQLQSKEYILEQCHWYRDYV